MPDPRNALSMAALISMLMGVSSLGGARDAHAQEIGDTKAGQQLADTWCSSCHVVGPTHDSAVSNGAPTFAAIAEMTSTTVLSLRAFLQTPHARMPDLHLSRDETDDLAAYILSLRRK